MLHFKEDERLTPTVLRRRIRTVESEMKSKEVIHSRQKQAVEKSKLELIAKEKALLSTESELRSLSGQLNRLTEDLDVAIKKSNRQVVTDHAVVQYINRVLGIDIQAIRQRISGGEAKKIRHMEGSHCIDRGEFSICIEDGVITTVLGDDMVHLNPVDNRGENIG